MILLLLREELQNRNHRESRQTLFYPSSINNIEKNRTTLTSIVSPKRKTVLIKSRQVCKFERRSISSINDTRAPESAETWKIAPSKTKRSIEDAPGDAITEIERKSARRST